MPGKEPPEPPIRVVKEKKKKPEKIGRVKCWLCGISFEVSKEYCPDCNSPREKPASEATPEEMVIPAVAAVPNQVRENVPVSLAAQETQNQASLRSSEENIILKLAQQLTFPINKLAEKTRERIFHDLRDSEESGLNLLVYELTHNPITYFENKLARRRADLEWFKNKYKPGSGKYEEGIENYESDVTDLEEMIEDLRRNNISDQETPAERLVREQTEQLKPIIQDLEQIPRKAESLEGFEIGDWVQVPPSALSAPWDRPRQITEFEDGRIIVDHDQMGGFIPERLVRMAKVEKVRRNGKEYKIGTKITINIKGEDLEGNIHGFVDEETALVDIPKKPENSGKYPISELLIPGLASQISPEEVNSLLESIQEGRVIYLKKIDEECEIKKVPNGNDDKYVMTSDWGLRLSFTADEMEQMIQSGDLEIRELRTPTPEDSDIYGLDKFPDVKADLEKAGVSLDDLEEQNYDQLKKLSGHVSALIYRYDGPSKEFLLDMRDRVGELIEKRGVEENRRLPTPEYERMRAEFSSAGIAWDAFSFYKPDELQKAKKILEKYEARFPGNGEVKPRLDEVKRLIQEKGGVDPAGPEFKKPLFDLSKATEETRQEIHRQMSILTNPPKTALKQDRIRQLEENPLEFLEGELRGLEVQRQTPQIQELKKRIAAAVEDLKNLAKESVPTTPPVPKTVGERTPEEAAEVFDQIEEGTKAYLTLKGGTKKVEVKSIKDGGSVYIFKYESKGGYTKEMRLSADQVMKYVSEGNFVIIPPGTPDEEAKTKPEKPELHSKRVDTARENVKNLYNKKKLEKKEAPEDPKKTDPMEEIREINKELDVLQDELDEKYSKLRTWKDSWFDKDQLLKDIKELNAKIEKLVKKQRSVVTGNEIIEDKPSPKEDTIWAKINRLFDKGSKADDKSEKKAAAPGKAVAKTSKKINLLNNKLPENISSARKPRPAAPNRVPPDTRRRPEPAPSDRPQEAKGAPEVRPFPVEYIEKKIGPLLESLGYKVVGSSDVIGHNREIEVQTTISSWGFNVHIELAFQSRDGNIVIAIKTIAGMLPGVEKKLKDNRDKLSETLKSFIEKDRGKKVEKIEIEDGQLVVTFQ